MNILILEIYVCSYFIEIILSCIHVHLMTWCYSKRKGLKGVNRFYLFVLFPSSCLFLAHVIQPQNRQGTFMKYNLQTFRPTILKMTCKTHWTWISWNMVGQSDIHYPTKHLWSSITSHNLQPLPYLNVYNSYSIFLTVSIKIGVMHVSSFTEMLIAKSTLLGVVCILKMETD